jgi:poly-gamma-glutamate synthesis protein (capsule biosynthesis protein)
MSANGSLILAACGDILLHGRYCDIAESGGADRVLDPLRRLLAECDLVVGNMETVLAKAETGSPRDDKLCLRGDPRYANCMAEAGFQVMTLANNHCLDFGPEALAETRRHLETAGIAVLGAGSDLDEAMRPVVLETRGVKLGFLAACHQSTKPAPAATRTGPGIAPLDRETILAAVEALAPEVDHVILLLHWGLEYANYPTPEQVELARSAVDRGASAVLGHHSHSLQGIETYAGGVIAYSLANFTDADVDWRGPSKHYRAELTEVDRESVLLRLRIDREGIEIHDRIPLWLDEDGRPSRAAGERARKIERQLEEYSGKLGDADLRAFWEDSVIESRVSAPLASWWHSGSLWDKVRRFRPGQLVTLFLLLRTYLTVKLSRSESRWLLFNTRNDTRPMPAAGNDNKGKQ